MADAAVRVDIISGQNTVIKSVELTKDKLLQLSGVSRGTNAAFANLSTGGVKRLEAGFQALAFQAAGVPGPLGKIASGAVLLAGGSGILLAVAAAAGTLAIIWKKFGAVSDEATEAEARMNKELHKQEQALLDIAAADAEVARQRGRAGFFAFFAEGGTSGILGWIAQHFSKIADEIERTADAYAALSAHGATDDWLMRFADTHPMPKAGKKAPADRAGPHNDAAFMNLNWQAMTPEVLAASAAVEQYIAFNREMQDVMSGTALSLEDVGNVFVVVNEDMYESMTKTADLFAMFGDAFTVLAEGIGAAIAGYGSFARVMVQAAAQALSAIASMEAKKEVAAAAASFAAGAWPPNPAAIAAGMKHLQAAALWKIAGGAAGVIGSVGAGMVGGGAGSGGVDGNRYQNDQQTIAARGTVTVSMKGGFIDPRSPEFQEFIAQVIKEAKGRNVVFA